MSLNPEFRRNIWLHISWQRLFGAPMVTLLAVAALMAANSDKLYQAAELACFVVLGLWGTRRAADSLSEEVSGGTWESQRMSGLGAWQMAWGKLIGGTAFVWYCAAFAILVLAAAHLQLGALADPEKPLAVTVYNLVLGGLFSHCVSFAVAIILLRKAVSYRRLTITLAQTCGFITFLAFAYGGLPFSGGGNPYGNVQGLLDQSLTSLGGEAQIELYKKAVAITLFGAWTVLAIYRLMRLELQYRNWPWAWTAFVAFMFLFGAAFVRSPNLGPVGWLIGSTLTSALLTYVSLFGDVRDPVRYRWALRAVWSGDFGQALTYTPWWLIAFVATIGGAVAAIIQIPDVEILRMAGIEFSRYFGAFMPTQLQISLALLLLFMLRDILVVLWLSAGPKRHRADVSGLIFVALVYAPLALILGSAGGKALLPIVLPVSMSGNALDFVPVLIENAIAGTLLYVRWQAATKLGKKY